MEIPNTVNRIAADAFTDNHEITSVYIPDSVTEIGDEAFWYCTGLKMVWMEDSVTKLGEAVFFNCSELAEVRLSNRIGVLSAGTFERCVELERLTLPEELTELGEYALPPAPDKKVTVPDGIRKINSGNIGRGDTYYATDISQVSGFPALQELALNDTELTLLVGREYPLYFNSGANAIWKSNKESVAEVGVTGNVRAKGEGMAVITATIYGKEYTCSVKVIDRKVDFFPYRNNDICAHIRNVRPQTFEKHW